MSSKVVVLYVFIAAAAACRGQAPAGGPGAPAGAAGRGGAPPAMPVEIVTLEPRPIEQTGDFVGIVRSRRTTTIQPQAEGILTAIAVSSGDRVAAGATLFEIDSAPEQAAVASLESIRAAREADAALARQNAERARTLLGVGAISQQELDQAATLERTAAAQLRAVDDQIRQQRAMLAHFRVVAPTAGVVGDVPVRPGDRVTRATVLTTVHGAGGLEVYVGIPVHQASALKVGLPVRILSDTGDVLATERVTFVAPSVDDNTQTVLIKAAVGSQGGQLRTEQVVRTQVLFATTPGLTIPAVSVTRINGQHFAFVAESAPPGLVARQRAVTVGTVVGNNYVVTGGLEAGDRLVVSGIQKIGDGMPVTAMPAGAKPAGGA